MARASALLSVLFFALGCDGKFAFDNRTSGGASSGGAGGAMQSGGTSSGGSSGTAGSGGTVSECETRCRAAQLTCLESRQWCVECVTNTDCLRHGGGYCSASGQTEHRCVRCLDDDHCASGEKCDIDTHSCVTICSRFDDPLCPATGPECNPSVGNCVACFDEDDCDDVRLTCSEGNARCVQCVDNNDCDSQLGRFCDPVLFLCVLCRDSGDCEDDQLCDPLIHICR